MKKPETFEKFCCAVHLAEECDSWGDETKLQELWEAMTGPQELLPMESAKKDGSCVLLKCSDSKELVKARYCDKETIGGWVGDEVEECPCGWYEKHEYSQDGDYDTYNMFIGDEKILGWLPLPQVKTQDKSQIPALVSSLQDDTPTVVAASPTTYVTFDVKDQAQRILKIGQGTHRPNSGYGVFPFPTDCFAEIVDGEILQDTVELIDWKSRAERGVELEEADNRFYKQGNLKMKYLGTFISDRRNK